MAHAPLTLRFTEGRVFLGRRRSGAKEPGRQAGRGRLQTEGVRLCTVLRICSGCVSRLNRDRAALTRLEWEAFGKGKERKKKGKKKRN